MIRPGEPWGSPTSSPPDVEVEGGDAALAAAVSAAPGALVRFRPDRSSDLARAVGLAPGPSPVVHGTALPLDALSLDARGGLSLNAGGGLSLNAGGGLSLNAGGGLAQNAGGGLACNMCVFGTPPDRLRWSSPALHFEVELDGRPWFSGRATTVVIATGQFLRRLDLVPRGHPGDGKAEIQLYELERRERRLMRARLASGTHLPHPWIRQRSAAAIELRCRPPAPSEVDGTPGPARTSHTTIEVVPGAYRLLI